MDDASYKRLLQHQRIVKDLLVGCIAPQRPAGRDDPPRLRQWHQAAVQAPDLDAFRRVAEKRGLMPESYGPAQPQRYPARWHPSAPK